MNIPVDDGEKTSAFFVVVLSMLVNSPYVTQQPTTSMTLGEDVCAGGKRR